MTIYRVKDPKGFEVTLENGVEMAFAYGDLVDIDGALLSLLIAEGKVEATDIVLPANDVRADSEYRAQQEAVRLAPFPVEK